MRGEVIVKDNLVTTHSSVYALGDVTGGLQLTPVAFGSHGSNPLFLLRTSL